MRLLKTYLKATLVLTLFTTCGVVSVNIWKNTALAADKDLSFLNLGDQQVKSQSIWDYIFRRRSGSSTRGPICVVAPDRGYVWHREPLFIWFGGEGELRVEVRGDTTSDVRWNDTISVPEGSGTRAIHSIAYNEEKLLPGKERLQPGEWYYFGIYSTGDELLIEVPFQLLPQGEWQDVQTALSNLSGESGDSQIWQRIDYFSRHSYHPDDGITEAGADDAYFLADAVQEFFSLGPSAEQDAYVDQIYDELCTDKN